MQRLAIARASARAAIANLLLTDFALDPRPGTVMELAPRALSSRIELLLW